MDRRSAVRFSLPEPSHLPPKVKNSNKRTSYSCSPRSPLSIGAVGSAGFEPARPTSPTHNPTHHPAGPRDKHTDRQTNRHTPADQARYRIPPPPARTRVPRKRMTYRSGEASFPPHSDLRHLPVDCLASRPKSPNSTANFGRSQ